MSSPLNALRVDKIIFDFCLHASLNHEWLDGFLRISFIYVMTVVANKKSSLLIFVFGIPN
jgi:hypothetical protein